MPIPVRLIVLLLLLPLFGCGFEASPSNVKVSEAPVGGLTASSFDGEYLQQLIETTRQAAEQRLSEAYERNNTPAAERTSHAITEGRYEQHGSRRLAVIELRYSRNPMRVTRISDIEGDRLITVSCISPLGAPIDPFAETGECAESVRQHLPMTQ